MHLKFQSKQRDPIGRVNECTLIDDIILWASWCPDKTVETCSLINQLQNYNCYSIVLYRR